MAELELASEAAGLSGLDARAEEADPRELRLPSLARRFRLSPLEVDALICLIAAEYEPIVRTLERALQRELGRPWLELGTVAELLGLPTERVPELARALAPDAPLRRWALVHTDDPSSTEVPAVFTRVKIATRVAQYLIGQDFLPDGIRLCQPPRPLLTSSLVPAATHAALVQRLRRARRTKEPVTVEIVGVPGTGRRAFAEGLAHELGVALVIADFAEPSSYADRGAHRLDERIAVARREAALQGALLALVGWLPPSPEPMGNDDGSGAPPPEPVHRLPRAIERLILDANDVLFLIAEERESLLARVATSLVHVTIPFPTPGQRAALLESAIERLGARIDGELDTNTLTRRFALDPERIEVAARAAVELARERAAPGVRALGDEREPELVLRASDIQEACRHQLRHDLKSLAQRVTNAHAWSDLVIPVDVYHSLKEMSSYVRHAEHVYDDWGFGARHSLAQGVSALFAGPPGTGKTMCAGVMARELDMELFRVDLSRVVSKWIGETEKNLGKVFDEAERSNAIILFDEADSLFAKRTEVKSSVDRYANLEVNYLLQRMEAFGGVTILTTNFEDTIDPAFKRRLTFRMRFEKPDAEARAALWKKMLPQGRRARPGCRPGAARRALRAVGRQHPQRRGPRGLPRRRRRGPDRSAHVHARRRARGAGDGAARAQPAFHRRRDAGRGQAAHAHRHARAGAERRPRSRRGAAERGTRAHHAGHAPAPYELTMRLSLLLVAIASCANTSPRMRLSSSSPVGATWSFVVEDHARAAQLLVDGRPRVSGCERAGVHLRCELRGLFPGGHTVELRLAGSVLRRSALVGTTWPARPIFVRARDLAAVTGAASAAADGVLIPEGLEPVAMEELVEAAHKGGIRALVEAGPNSVSTSTLVERYALDGLVGAALNPSVARRFPEARPFAIGESLVETRGALGLGLALLAGRGAIIDSGGFPLLAVRRRHKALREGTATVLFDDGQRRAVRLAAGGDAITLVANASAEPWSPTVELPPVPIDLLGGPMTAKGPTVPPGELAAILASPDPDRTRY